MQVLCSKAWGKDDLEDHIRMGHDSQHNTEQGRLWCKVGRNGSWGRIQRIQPKKVLQGQPKQRFLAQT